ncbi:MAG: dienelactone hydrolase family protein [Candidatus Rokubacteria bacterium]|nr:dienelactone hydrolase family protein [Candidatus Rokubacteria bacterium]
MLQRISFPVAGVDVEGILHLPDAETLGGVAVLPTRSGLAEHGTFVCEALAATGIAALRFDSRVAGDMLAGLADAAGAVRLLRAHPTIPQRVGVLGHSYAAGVAALAAGRDSRVRAAVLLAPPAERDYFGALKPMAELSRTRARVLIVKAAADEIVSPDDADRYAALVRQAGVTHRLVTIADADHQFTGSTQRAQMLAAVTEWFRDAFA